MYNPHTAMHEQQALLLGVKVREGGSVSGQQSMMEY